jgi:hypothetical protein
MKLWAVGTKRDNGGYEGDRAKAKQQKAPSQASAPIVPIEQLKHTGAQAKPGEKGNGKNGPCV